MPISSRWPTAEESTERSPSKYSSWRASPPSVRAMSAATEGFSAMIRRLAIGPCGRARLKPGREGVNDKQGPAREQGKPGSKMREAARAHSVLRAASPCGESAQALVRAAGQRSNFAGELELD